jgi:hypothetical protein
MYCSPLPQVLTTDPASQSHAAMAKGLTSVQKSARERHAAAPFLPYTPPRKAQYRGRTAAPAAVMSEGPDPQVKGCRVTTHKWEVTVYQVGPLGLAGKVTGGICAGAGFRDSHPPALVPTLALTTS